MSVLKVRIEGQRIRYEVSKVTFADNDLLKANAWRWDEKKNSLYLNDKKLDILRDYETFDCEDIGVAIRTNGEIYYELGNDKGKLASRKVLYSPYHPMLIAIDDANEEDGMTLTSANVYDKKNTIYEYTVEVGDGELFDASLLAIIAIRCPITDEERIVQLLYAGKEMEGRAEGLSFMDEPVSKNSMLTVPNDYAVAIGLGENRKLDNLLRFDEFLKEENSKVRKGHKVSENYIKIREDYIHSFIDEHERDNEIPEEE
jgi:hypothetical protein